MCVCIVSKGFQGGHTEERSPSERLLSSPLTAVLCIEWEVSGQEERTSAQEYAAFSRELVVWGRSLGHSFLHGEMRVLLSGPPSLGIWDTAGETVFHMGSGRAGIPSWKEQGCILAQIPGQVGEPRATGCENIRVSWVYPYEVGGWWP
jgi:hypothetical protein